MGIISNELDQRRVVVGSVSNTAVVGRSLLLISFLGVWSTQDKLREFCGYLGLGPRSLPVTPSTSWPLKVLLQTQRHSWLAALVVLLFLLKNSEISFDGLFYFFPFFFHILEQCFKNVIFCQSYITEGHIKTDLGRRKKISSEATRQRPRRARNNQKAQLRNSPWAKIKNTHNVSKLITQGGSWKNSFMQTLKRIK